MSKIYKYIMQQLPCAVDPLFTSVMDLKNTDRDDVITCTVLCTRAKIYTKTIEAVKLLKHRKFNEISPLISRILKLIRIHRMQLYKLSKKTALDLSNFLYFKKLSNLLMSLQIYSNDHC